MDNVAAAPPARQKIFHWALKVAEERLPYRVERKPMPLGLKIKSAIADKLVFGKIIARLGGNVKYVVSGGAPLSAELAAFFIGAGVEILEGYGLTETSPVIAVNRPDKRRIGTVGPIIPGVEVKIAADGEILSRGPNIMKGYWNNPEATAQAIDAGGLVPHRRHRRDRQGRLPQDHRPQEGHHHQRLRQEHRAAADRGAAQELAVRRHAGADRRPPQVPLRADRPELREARARGRRRSASPSTSREELVERRRA